MLREDERTLIASGVDGPLIGAVAAQFRDLIANNPEANAFYHSLVSDRDRLTALPKWPAPYSIAQNISQRIYPKVIPSTTLLKTPRRTAAWLPYAFAASVFVAVAAGSFLVFQEDSTRRDIAERKERSSLPGVHLPLPDRGNTFAAANREELPGPDSEQLPLPSHTTIANRETKPESKPEKSPSTNSNEWLTARIASEIPKLESVSARLPYLFNMTEASQADTKKRFVEEYFANTAVRLDLFVRDVPKAMEVFQNAAKSSGMAIVTVPLTSEQLKRKLPITIAVYTESLTANEHVAFLAKLATSTGAAQTFAQGHLISATASDSRDLKALFGIDPGLGKRPTSEEASEPSIASGTLGSVKQAIAKDTPKSALVTTFGPTVARMNPTHSQEIKTFFDKRGERPASAIPALIVIRHINDK